MIAAILALVVCALLGAPLFSALFLGASLAYPTAGLNPATDFLKM